MCEQQREEERANEMKYIERFKEEGATVEELTPEEVAAFTEAVQPVYDLWREKVGDETIDAWRNRSKALISSSMHKKTVPGTEGVSVPGTADFSNIGDEGEKGGKRVILFKVSYRRNMKNSKLKRVLNVLDRTEEMTIIGMFAVMVIVIFLQVIMRKVFNNSLTWL